MTNATANLSAAQRQLRQNVRNFLLVATPDELRAELQISLDRYDADRATFIREIMVEEGVLEVIETGVINKDNWTGEEANVRGWFDKEAKTIDFEANDYDWRLTFLTWEQIDPQVDRTNETQQDRDDLVRLIGSGVWALASATSRIKDGQVYNDGKSFGKPETIENGERDHKTPKDVLASAARWVWKYV